MAISWSNMYHWSVDFLYSHWHPLISCERTQSSKYDCFSANAFDKYHIVLLRRKTCNHKECCFLTHTCIDLSLTTLQLGNHCFLSFLINCMHATRECTFILKSYPLPCLPVSPYKGSRIILFHSPQATTSTLHHFDPLVTNQIVSEAPLSASEMLVRCFKDTQRALLRMSSPIGWEKQFYTLARCLLIASLELEGGGGTVCFW